MQSFNKDGILSRLQQLNDDLLALFPDHMPFELIIVGGSALVLRNLAPSKTTTIDIDALRTATELESLLARYDINTNVDTFKFQFPSHYDERIVQVPFEGTMLTIYTLSNEDLAITKLLAWREQDKQDLKGMLEADNIDMHALHQIISDMTELQINLEESAWILFMEHLSEFETWNA